MLLRRGLIERMGGIYNPKYRWAWADADLGMRLAKYHANGTGVPEAEMEHFGRYSSKRLSPQAIMFLYALGQKHWEKDWGHSTRYFARQFQLDSKASYVKMVPRYLHSGPYQYWMRAKEAVEVLRGR